MKLFDRPGIPIGRAAPYQVVKSNGVWVSKHDTRKDADRSMRGAMAVPVSMGGYDELFIVDSGGNVVASKKGRVGGRASAEPRIGSRVGTFEFDRHNATSRQKVGALMQQYHSSMGDPYYAVGSYYYGNHTYPRLDIVESALGHVESDIRKAEQGLSGWGKQEVLELKTIQRYLKWDIRRTKREAKAKGAGHASGRKKMTRAAHNKALFAKMSKRKAELMRKGRSAEGAGQQAYRETFGARNRAERARTRPRTRGRSSGAQVAEKDRRKVILAIYRATNVSDKMLRNKKHTVMLVGDVAKRYGVSNYTNVVLEDASSAELLKIAEAYNLFKSQRGRSGGERLDDAGGYLSDVQYHLERHGVHRDDAIKFTNTRWVTIAIEEGRKNRESSAKVAKRLFDHQEPWQHLKKKGRAGGRDDSSSHRTRREAARIAELIWTHRKKNNLSPRMSESQVRKAAELVGSGGVSGMTDLVVREYKMRLAELN